MSTENEERNIHDNVMEAPVDVEQIKEEVQEMPVTGEDAPQAIMSGAMHEEMMRKQQEFYLEVIKVSANKIISGEVSGIIAREHLPKNNEILALDDQASSWNISIMMEMMEMLKEDEVFNDKDALAFMEGFIDLFNRKFITWHMWKGDVDKFIEKYIARITRKVPANIDWRNFTEWVRYSLINTNPVRGEVVHKYFQPTEDQGTQPQA